MMHPCFVKTHRVERKKFQSSEWIVFQKVMYDGMIWGTVFYRKSVMKWQLGF